MKIVRSIGGARRAIAQWHTRGESVGLVPTMGALHQGHLSLIRRCRKRAKRTVVSIFVNPTQFSPEEDYKSYPRTWRRDISLCHEEGAEIVFAPDVGTMYPDGFETTVRVGSLGDYWEGTSRPGHFDGVATVVLKLFEIIRPDVAVFGQKDYQQTIIIRRLIEDFNLPVGLIVAPTVREPGGLALSSRNVYLGAAERVAAGAISRSLRWAADRIRKGARSSSALARQIRRIVETGGFFTIDYIGFCDPSTLASQRRPNPPVVILIAAKCLAKSAACGRRYIDNIVVR